MFLHQNKSEKTLFKKKNSEQKIKIYTHGKPSSKSS